MRRVSHLHAPVAATPLSLPESFNRPTSWRSHSSPSKGSSDDRTFQKGDWRFAVVPFGSSSSPVGIRNGGGRCVSFDYVWKLLWNVVMDLICILWKLWWFRSGGWTLYADAIRQMEDHTERHWHTASDVLNAVIVIGRISNLFVSFGLISFSVIDFCESYADVFESFCDWSVRFSSCFFFIESIKNRVLSN